MHVDWGRDKQLSWARDQNRMRNVFNRLRQDTWQATWHRLQTRQVFGSSGHSSYLRITNIVRAQWAVPQSSHSVHLSIHVSPLFVLVSAAGDVDQSCIIIPRCHARMRPHLVPKMPISETDMSMADVVRGRCFFLRHVGRGHSLLTYVVMHDTVDVCGMANAKRSGQRRHSRSLGKIVCNSIQFQLR